MIIKPARRLKELKEYYFSVKLKEVKSLIDSGKKVINLGIGSPDLAPSDETVQALIESARNPHNHGYQPYKGIPLFRKAISDWYSKTYQVKLDTDKEILPLIGSKEGITHISLTFLDPGDDVLVPELGYPTYTSVSKMAGANVVTYPLNEAKGYAPDWKKMEGRDYSNVKIMWANYPHMPTGARATNEIFENIIDFAHRHKILVCHDNPYSLILNESDPKSILSFDGAKEACLELNSLSKSHNMAGWRVGWLCGEQQYIDEVLKVKSNVDSGMFLPVQHAAIKAFENNDEWHKQRNKIYKERKALVFEILNRLQCTYDPHQTGLFAWAKLPGHVGSAEEIVDHLLNEFHIFVAPGFIFGTPGERYIRISLCNDVSELSEALRRLDKYKM